VAGGIGYGGIVEIFLPPGGLLGQVLQKASDANYDFVWGAGAGATAYTEVVATFDNGSTVLPLGDTKTYYEVRSAGTIVEWALTGTPAGSVVIDIWKAPGAIPTAADTIVAAAPPNLVASALGNSAVLTGWNTTINVGDVLGFGINSASAVAKAVLTLRIQKL
jgi:hypothetical protein